MPSRQPLAERIKGKWPMSDNIMDLRSRNQSILEWLMADAIANPNKHRPGGSSTHYKTSKQPKRRPQGLMSLAVNK